MNARCPLDPLELECLLRTRPMTPDDLHFWVKHVLGLDVPRAPVCGQPGHCSPFDYLQRAFFEEFSDAVIWANRGGGKTLLGAAATLLDALFKPGTAVRILGGSLEQSQKMNGYLRRLLLPRFADQLAGADGRGRSGRGGLAARCVRFRNGSEVEVLAQSERSVRGNRVQKMRCDEAELFDRDVWTSCQLVTESREIESEPFRISDFGFGNEDSDAPIRLAANVSERELSPHPFPLSQGERGNKEDPQSEIRNPKLIRGAVEAFSTMHRAHGLMHHIVEEAARRGSPVFRWCVLDVIERCGPGRDCAACPLAPDCGGRAKDAAGFYRIDDAIAARARVSRDTWEAEMLCQRPSRRGAVFPAFSRSRHVGPLRCQPGWPLFRAIDFGFVNPFVCLWVQVSPAGDVLVLGEYLRSRATLAAHVAQLRDLDPGPVKATYCDPAGGQSDQITGTSARGELKAAGIDTKARSSAITDGLEVIRRYLESAPTLRIDPSCERLIAAMEAYRYPDEADARGGSSELPIKDGVHDHPIDALRYFFINHLAALAGRLIERMY